MSNPTARTTHAARVVINCYREALYAYQRNRRLLAVSAVSREPEAHLGQVWDLVDQTGKRLSVHYNELTRFNLQHIADDYMSLMVDELRETDAEAGFDFHEFCTRESVRCGAKAKSRV